MILTSFLVLQIIGVYTFLIMDLISLLFFQVSFSELSCCLTS
uniref:Uncharacterized protein n=1 Tax=Populus trichocarpa TaxID=3694 RepID=A0A3N7HYF5_POPTR